MDYSISLNRGEGGFRLPVNPGAIDVKESGHSTTYDISKLGEINVIGNPKLAEISFESIFPAANYPFVLGNLREPGEYVEIIERWMQLKKPVRFVFAGSSFDLNSLVSLESFSWREVGGAVGDIEYNLALKKYQPYGARRVEIKQESTRILSTQQPARSDDRDLPKTYTLVAGDTLWAVAKRFLGNGARYPEIQRLNNITDAQLTRLPIGLVVKLP